MIQLDPASPVPLYRQIAVQIRRLIAIGAFEPGDRLPAVRDLAIQVRVNRNTAARAIQQLESEGLVRTRVGQGTFVEESPTKPDRRRRNAAVDAAIDGLLVEAESLGVLIDELPPRLERRIAGFRRKQERKK